VDSQPTHSQPEWLVRFLRGFLYSLLEKSEIIPSSTFYKFYLSANPPSHVKIHCPSISLHFKLVFAPTPFIKTMGIKIITINDEKSDLTIQSTNCMEKVR